MKIQLSKIINSTSYLKTFASMSGFGGKATYNISRTYNACLEEEKLYLELRNKKLLELADKDEKGSPITEVVKDEKGVVVKDEKGNDLKYYKLSTENKEVFRTFENELLEQEVDVFLTHLKIADIKNVVGLTPLELNNLVWLFQEEVVLTKIQLSKIINSIVELSEFSSLLGFDVDLTYNLATAYNYCTEEGKNYLDLRNKKLLELVDKDESGNAVTEILKDEEGNDVRSYKFSGENKELFLKFENELLNQEVEIALKPISIDSLENVSNLKPITLSKLSWLFAE